MKVLLGSLLEGLLSFLSPCVLPLVPLYMSYLSSEDDNDQKKTFIRTLFFVLGIFTVIILLAISVDAIKEYIEDYKDIISIVGSVIIILFGLHEIGLINISILNKEARLKVDLKLDKMNFLKAYLFGFIFSFAWSPCIGPMLTSALITSISDGSGVLNIIAYGLGLAIPFLICGLFTGFILKFIKKYKKISKVITIICGVVLLIFGIYLGYNASKNIVNTKRELESNSKDSSYTYLTNITLYDALGNKYSLKDYKGKYIYLNFTATWCTYCKEEIPSYMSFQDEHDDVVCFYVMNKDVNGGSNADIKDYYIDNNLSIPILVDDDLKLFNLLGADGFPTLWIIGPDTSVIGYQSGALNEEYFEYIYNRATEAYNNR